MWSFSERTVKIVNFLNFLLCYIKKNTVNTFCIFESFFIHFFNHMCSLVLYRSCVGQTDLQILNWNNSKKKKLSWSTGRRVGGKLNNRLDQSVSVNVSLIFILLFLFICLSVCLSVCLLAFCLSHICIIIYKFHRFSDVFVWWKTVTITIRSSDRGVMFPVPSSFVGNVPCFRLF